MSKIENFLWVERYRPNTVEECILPKELKSTFQSFVDNRKVPNVILAGRPGMGKTTVALAVTQSIDAQTFKINASLKGNIETLRTEIMEFASSVSVNGQRKYVMLDEADKCSIAFQDGLRTFIEEFSGDCGFILTCNHKSRLIEPLHSRCPVIEFRIPKDEIRDILTQQARRVINILTQEKVTFKTEVVVEVLKRWFPDLRRAIGEFQTYAQKSGRVIDDGILSRFTEARLSELLKAMQERNFSTVRKWVTDNSDIDTADLYRMLYDQAATLVTPESVPALAVILARYQFQSQFVADQDINTSAALAELMVELQWK